MRKEEKMIFVPAWVDDIGLSPFEFRIYGHLSRRAHNASGKAWPSIATIAKACGVSEATTKRALKELTDRGMIERIGKPFGGTTRYRLVPFFKIFQPDTANKLTGDHIGEPPISSVVTGLTSTNQVISEPIATGSPESQLTAGNKLCGDPFDLSPISSHRATNQVTTEPPISSVVTQEGNLCKGTQLRESISIGDLELSLETEEQVIPAKIREKKAEEIYQAYPRKAGKEAAIASILKAMKKHSPEKLLERTQAYASAIAWKERTFIPHPSTWFNQGRFDDPPEEWADPAATAAPTSGARKPLDLGGRKMPQYE